MAKETTTADAAPVAPQTVAPAEPDVAMAQCRQCQRQFPLSMGLVETRVATLPRQFNPQATMQVITCPICQAHLEKNNVAFNESFTTAQLAEAERYVEAERQRKLVIQEKLMKERMKPGPAEGM